MKVIIYSTQITNRLKYIFELVFNTILKVDVDFVSSTEEIDINNSILISYNTKPTDTGLFFSAHSLLFEKGISEQQISVFDWENSKAFFKAHEQSALPFDPFATSFYLVSRYEEYLPHRTDLHDRYDVSESLAFQNDFLHQPVVNRWAMRSEEHTSELQSH